MVYMSRSILRPRRSAVAGSRLQFGDATARERDNETPRRSSSLVTVRCTATSSAGGALALQVAAAAPQSATVHVAYALQQAGHRYLDVRTESEFSAVHPESAVNIPYLFRTGSGTTKNAHFLEQVARIFGKDDGIIVGCQSGRRSLMAATELCSAGFTAVKDVASGFSSWKESGLPVNSQAALLEERRTVFSAVDDLNGFSASFEWDGQVNHVKFGIHRQSKNCRLIVRDRLIVLELALIHEHRQADAFVLEVESHSLVTEG